MPKPGAERYYYPPDFEPEKHKTLNKLHGSHALRERARKLDEGILIIRFEVPFNIWCLGCDKMIAKGVRFNAEKKHIGNYFSTKIWSFRMRCVLCSQWIEVHTDPKNADYKFVHGARKKIEEWVNDDPNSVKFASVDEKLKLQDDLFYRAEHLAEDRRRAEDSKPVLNALIHMQDSKKNDYDLNRALRGKNREERVATITDMRQMRDKGVHIEVARETPEEIEDAKRQYAEDRKSYEQKKALMRQAVQRPKSLKPSKAVRRSGIFGASYASGSSGSTFPSSGISKSRQIQSVRPNVIVRRKP